MNVGVLPLRHNILSAPSSVFWWSRSMCNIRSQLTRALLPGRCINIFSMYLWRCDGRLDLTLFRIPISFCRRHWSKILRRATILRMLRSFSSTRMAGRSCVPCSSVLPAFRQSQLSQISSSYFRPSSRKHHWKARNGFWMCYMGSVLSFSLFIPLSSGLILGRRVISSVLAQVQKPRTL
jgi:hypothetical protein